VWSGGLQIRSVAKLGSTAFIASAAGTRILQTQSLAADEEMSVPLHHWQSLSGLPTDDVLHVGSQRVLDSVVFGHILQSLVINQTTQYHQLLVAAAAHIGDWLHALPISACGFRLKDEAIRVAVGLRLGSEICQPYHCASGASVDTRGSHALLRKRYAALSFYQ